MINRRKKLNRLYLKLTIKTPITIIALISIGLISMYYLTVTTSTNIYKTYSAKVFSNDKGVLCANLEYDDLDGQIDKNSQIYWYINKSGKTYKARNYELVEEKGRNVIRIIFKEDEAIILRKAGNGSINIDIPIDRVSIFDRIINKGRAENGKKQ